MVKTLARIQLYSGIKKRTTPIKSGYRPTFNFVEKSRTSGQIGLINMDLIYPGETAVVEIVFLNQELLGEEFKQGTNFLFYEGEDPLGEGVVLEIF